jgi:5-formyltetrahydrofolate cyclo-ligase
LSKEHQRKEAKNAIANMACQSVENASISISHCLRSLATIQSSSTIMSFLPLTGEVDLRPLMQQWIDEGKTVCVPIVQWDCNSMRAGLLTSMEPKHFIERRHKLLEPKDPQIVPLDSIDVVLVPGLAFDALGGRLGRGGGFYDRFLSHISTPLAIGVAFDEQIVGKVHREPHDYLLTAIATQSGLLTS